MNDRQEGTLAVAAALLVLFSTMLDPRISLALAVAALVGLGAYHLLRKA